MEHWKYETRKVVNEGNSLLYHSAFSTSILVKNQQQHSWLSWNDGVALQRLHLQIVK